MDSPRDPLWQRYDEMMDYLVPPERLRREVEEAKKRLARASAPSQESVVGEEDGEAVSGPPSGGVEQRKLGACGEG